MDRIHELSNASVPFSFDVHAMIFSENAPELEMALHRHFLPPRSTSSIQGKSSSACPLRGFGRSSRT
ncbi:MAG: GIY-YIG nuclease family protein [Janthinobacterium lividum]